MMSHLYNKPVRPVFDNTVDALIPEIWASLGLAILEANMVVGNLVHRDYEAIFAKFGDIVNTRKPREFVAKRKTKADEVTVQDAILDNIPVTLDQHIHTSFMIKDGEESMAMQDLVRIFLEPAMKSQAKLADEIVSGQYAQFLTTAGVGGELGGMTSSNAKEFFLNVGEKLDTALAPDGNRVMVVPPHLKNIILQNATFSEADKRGDAGSALRNASLGRILGFDTFMAQNMASVATGQTTRQFLIDEALGYVAGDSVLTIDTGTGEITNGSWVKIKGKPYRVTAHTGAAPTTAITVSPVLREAVLNNATVDVLTPGAVNFVAGYDAGYSKEIVVNGFTTAPKRGQFLTFGTSSTIYTIVGTPSTTSILLDRPLAAAVAHAATVNLGPNGEYGFAIANKNALALVCRPLAMPKSGAGALSAAVAHNGFSMRAVISYDARRQGHLVTLDMLLGVAVLDLSYGAVLLG